MRVILLITINILFFNLKGQNYLFSQSSYTYSGFPTNCLKGDFNNDGKIDLVIQDQGGLSTRLQLPGNTFSTVITTYSNYLEIYSCEDFNGDGNLDVLGNNNTLFLGNGNGGFVVTTNNQNFSSYASLVCDFNNDGLMDVADVDSSPNALLKVYIGQGNGNFNTAITNNLSGQRSLNSSYNSSIDKDLIFLRT